MRNTVQFGREMNGPSAFMRMHEPVCPISTGEHGPASTGCTTARPTCQSRRRRFPAAFNRNLLRLCWHKRPRQPCNLQRVEF